MSQRSVYLSIPVSGVRLSRDQYRVIVDAVRTGGGSIVNPEVVTPFNSPYPENGVSASHIFNQNCSLLARADLLLAEISTPSHGVGLEIALAKSMGLPVFALYLRPQYEAGHVSAMLLGNENIRLYPYNDPEDILPIVADALSYPLTFGARLDVILEGIGGSGKTTQMNSLYRRLGEYERFIPVLRIPEFLPNDSGTSIEMLLTDKLTLQLGTQRQGGWEVLLMLAEICRKLSWVAKALPHGCALFDGLFLSQEAHALALLPSNDPGHGKLVKDSMSILTRSAMQSRSRSVTFYLACPVEQAAERIEIRRQQPLNRDERLFLRRLAEAYDSLVPNRDICRVDASAPADEVTRFLWERIEQEVTKLI